MRGRWIPRYYDGYKGPITPASSAVAANYTIVDMFASVATGNATPEAAAKHGCETSRAVLQKPQLTDARRR